MLKSVFAKDEWERFVVSIQETLVKGGCTQATYTGSPDRPLDKQHNPGFTIQARPEGVLVHHVGANGRPICKMERVELYWQILTAAHVHCHLDRNPATAACYVLVLWEQGEG